MPLPNGWRHSSFQFGIPEIIGRNYSILTYISSTAPKAGCFLPLAAKPYFTIKRNGWGILLKHPQQDFRISGLCDIRQNRIHHFTSVATVPIFRKRMDADQFRVSRHGFLSRRIPPGDAVRSMVYFENIPIAFLFLQQFSIHRLCFGKICTPVQHFRR